MYDTHSPAEWAQMVSLAVGMYAAASAPYFLLVDADLADFNPQPALAWVVESGALDPLLIVIGPAWVAIRETYRDAAALALLLTTSPKGAMA